MPVDAYFEETARLMTEPSLVERLRGMLTAAEELERRGVELGDAWRENEDWQRLARIRLVLLGVAGDLGAAVSRENVDRWRERQWMRQSINLVEKEPSTIGGSRSVPARKMTGKEFLELAPQLSRETADEILELLRRSRRPRPHQLHPALMHAPQQLKPGSTFPRSKRAPYEERSFATSKRIACRATRGRLDVTPLAASPPASSPQVDRSSAHSCCPTGW